MWFLEKFIEFLSKILCNCWVKSNVIVRQISITSWNIIIVELSWFFVLFIIASWFYVVFTISFKLNYISGIRSLESVRMKPKRLDKFNWRFNYYNCLTKTGGLNISEGLYETKTLTQILIEGLNRSNEWFS